MECACIDTSYANGNAAKAHWTRMMTARKSHTCCECGEEIQPGELYEVIVFVDEGFERFKTCIPCVSIARDIYCGGRVVGALRDDVREELGFDYVTGEESPTFDAWSAALQGEVGSDA